MSEQRERRLFGVLAGFEALIAARSAPIAPAVVARVLRLVRETLDVPVPEVVLTRRAYQRQWVRAHRAREREARPPKPEAEAKQVQTPRPVGRPRLTQEEKQARKREWNLRYRAKVAARSAGNQPGAPPHDQPGAQPHDHLADASNKAAIAPPEPAPAPMTLDALIERARQAPPKPSAVPPGFVSDSVSCHVVVTPPAADAPILALTDRDRANIEEMLAEEYNGREIARDLMLPLGLVAIYVTACRERGA